VLGTQREDIPAWYLLEYLYVFAPYRLAIYPHAGSDEFRIMAHYVYSPLATPEHIRLLKVQTSCDEVNTTVDAKFDIIPVTLYETPGSMPGSPRTVTD